MMDGLMFSRLLDIPNGLAVLLFTRGQNSELDWTAYCDAIREAPRVLVGHPRPFALQVIDPSSSDPTAKWRREIANASEGVPPRATIAVVSQSRLVRGMILAISWLRPPTYALRIVATEDDACELAQLGCPGRAAAARTLIRRLRQEQGGPPKAGG
ncbi:MAG: hypothetical protein ABIP39_14295 [Polyangiaceae bacterium]